MILGEKYTEEHTEKVSSKKGSLKPAVSIVLVTGESVGSAVYIADQMKPKQKPIEEKSRERQCTAVYQKIIPSMSEAYLYLRSDERGVQVASSYKNLVKNRQALVTQGIVEVSLTRSFIVMMPQRSFQKVLVAKEIKVASCLAAPTSWVDPPNAAIQKQGIAPEDGVNATEI